MPNYLLNAGGDDRALEDIERRIRLAIPDLKRVASFEDIAKPSLREGTRSIAIVLAPAAATDFPELVGRIGKRKKDVFFVVVGGDLSARDYKLLMQTGNAEWVAEAGSTEEILNIVRREKEAIGAGAPDRPVVVSFVPSGGGVGNTTLAIESAVQLAKRKVGKGGRVALIDLDFQTSHVCDYLDLAPKFRVEEIIEAPERLDDHLLDVFASRHSSGVDVFAAPRERLRVRDLDVDSLSALFERMAHHYAYILADLPVSAHSWTGPLLAASEGILVTGVNTIPGLRQIADAVRAIRAERAVYADVRIIINRCELSVFGKIARNDHVTRVLGEEKVFYVRDTASAIECVNMGEPITLARTSDKILKDVGAIVDHCLALQPA